MDVPVSDTIRSLTVNEQKFVDKRRKGASIIRWSLLVSFAVLAICGTLLPFWEGEIGLGIFTTLGMLLASSLVVKGVLDYETPDIDEPIITTQTGYLAEESGLSWSKYEFDGRPIRLPWHWVDFLRGEGKFEAEVAFFPSEDKPYLLSTSTGLSVDKEADWGLMKTYAGRPNRWLVVLFGMFFNLLYGTVVALKIYESAPLLNVLLVGDGDIITFLIGGGFVMLGIPAAVFFVQDRLAFRRIWNAYLENREHAVPSRAEVWSWKKRQIKGTLMLSVPASILFGWTYGFPFLGALLGVVIGVPIGYLIRGVPPQERPVSKG